MWEALKKMKKGISYGPSEVSCEILLNDVGVRELCGVAKSVHERKCARVLKEEHTCSIV